MEDVDVFIGGREDAEKLFGIRVEKELASPTETYLELGAKLKDRFGFELAALSLRDSLSASVNRLSAVLYDGKKCHTSREYEMQIVDRVGGGDAFTAGLIFGVLSDYTPKRTIEFATAAACIKHSIPGDFNLASVEEVEELLSGDGSGRIQR